MKSDMYRNFDRLDKRVDELFRGIDMIIRSTAFGSVGGGFKESKPLGGIAGNPNHDHFREFTGKGLKHVTVPLPKASEIPEEENQTERFSELSEMHTRGQSSGL